MPPAARVNDPTSHGPPLNPGPGSADVVIGFMPAWRALPAGMGGGLESASDTMDQLMKSPVLTPADATPKLVQVQVGMMQSAAQAAGGGNPAAAGTTASSFATLTGTNVGLTATWTAASAVPGGQPAANTAYTQAIKAAAAAAASAAMSAVAGMTDMHICPIPCPVPPHGPGVVTKGSKSVLINKLPACRQNDKVIEACGGADPIAMGCPTVLIGDDGGGPATAGSPAAAAAGAAGSDEQTQAQSSTAVLAEAAEAGTPLIEIFPTCSRIPPTSHEKRHYVAFQVVDDETNEPLRGVVLKITLPDGTEETHTTGNDGMIEIDDLENPGTCEIRCEITGAKHDQTYDFVRVESAPSGG